MWTDKIFLSCVCKIVSLQLGAINKFLPTVGLIADILLLIVHVSVLAKCADINKGLAAVLVAAEEKDLCGGFRLGRLCLQHYGVFLGASVPILSDPLEERAFSAGGGEIQRDPLLDPARGEARRAADRLRLRLLRRVVVPVAPRSGGRRRVLHRRPFFPVRRWLARSPLGFRLSLSPAAVAGGSEQPLGRFRLGRSEPELTFARGFNGGRRKPSALRSSLRPINPQAPMMIVLFDMVMTMSSSKLASSCLSWAIHLHVVIYRATEAQGPQHS